MTIPLTLGRDPQQYDRGSSSSFGAIPEAIIIATSFVIIHKQYFFQVKESLVAALLLLVVTE